MLTKTDLKQIKEIFDSSIEPFRKEVAKEFVAIYEDMVLFKDEILHEIIDLRDDVAVVTGYRDMIEDHEIRITKLEKKRLTN